MVKIIAGQKALEHIPYELASFGARRPLIITDAGVAQAGLIEPVKKALLISEVPVVAIYSDVPPDSSTTLVSRIRNVFQRFLACNDFNRTEKFSVSLAHLFVPHHKTAQHAEVDLACTC
jgi:hypothetical protein